jgi:nucleoside-diphosphate-sugar epimerase
MTQSKRIFITGATGFVGATLVRHFAARDWEVTASGRTDPPKPLLELAKYVRADIQHDLPRQAADVVVHAAALASDSARWADLKRANVDGTRHVFEATRDCRCFIYISSSSVYDFQNAVHFEDESVDYQQLSPYGRSKRMAEDWLLEQDWSGRNLFILRPRAVYGVGDRVLLPRLLRLVKFGQIMAPGDMRVSCSLTHVDNLAAAVGCCAEQKLPESFELSGSSIFNVADEKPYEMREVVHMLLSEIHGKNLTFRALPIPPLRYLASTLEVLQLAKQFTPYSIATVSKNCVLDIQKIEKILGYLPKRDLWSTFPELSGWARHVGLGQIQRAAEGLPWSSDTFLPDS